MRVSTRPGRGDEGATAIIFALSLFALLGIAALAVDAGQLWWNRRSLVIDTDAAALAAAGYARDKMVATPGLCATAGAADEAAKVIAANSTTTAFDKADPNRFKLTCVAGSTYGHVRVAATDRSTFAFAQIFGGADKADVLAASDAEFGPLVAADHLRPIPLCTQPTSTPYGAWKQWKTSGTPPSPGLVLGWNAGNPVFKVLVDQANFEAYCNTAGWTTSGDFLWIDFDGGGKATPCPTEKGGGSDEIKDRFNSPYPCTVYTHEYAQGHNCRPDQGGVWSSDNCPSQSGNVTSIIHCVKGSAGAGCYDQRCPSATAASECPYKWTLLLYDQLVGIKNDGSPCTVGDPGWKSCDIEFHPAGLVVAVLRDAVNGTAGNPNYFALEFIANATEQGVIGGPGTNSTHLNITGVRLCGADAKTNCKG